MHNQTRIVLKNLKTFEYGSEETLCYTATVHFDDQAVAHASNEGHGGMTVLRPIIGLGKNTREPLKAAEAFAATLTDPSNDGNTPIALDHLVDCIACAMHEDKRLRNRFNRDIRNKVLFIKNEKVVFLRNTNLRDIKDRPAYFARLRREQKADIIILDELPREEAFILWKRYVVRNE